MNRKDIPPMIPLEEVKRRMSEPKKDPITQKPIKKVEPLKIQGIQGFYAQAVFPIDDVIVLGRGPSVANIVYPEESVHISRSHCRIEKLDDTHIRITDTGSSNGTFMKDGMRMKENVAYSMSKGDEFYLAIEEERYRII